ncbi:MAG: hypothetical protein ACXV8O_01385 [Methylobacter sp.]
MFQKIKSFLKKNGFISLTEKELAERASLYDGKYPPDTEITSDNFLKGEQGWCINKEQGLRVYGHVNLEYDAISITSEDGIEWFSAKYLLPEESGQYLTCDHPGDYPEIYEYSIIDESWEMRDNEFESGWCGVSAPSYWTKLPMLTTKKE